MALRKQEYRGLCESRAETNETLRQAGSSSQRVRLKVPFEGQESARDMDGDTGLPAMGGAARCLNAVRLVRFRRGG